MDLPPADKEFAWLQMNVTKTVMVDITVDPERGRHVFTTWRLQGETGSDGPASNAELYASIPIEYHRKLFRRVLSVAGPSVCGPSLVLAEPRACDS